MLPLRPREVVMRVQSIFVAAERWKGVISRGVSGIEDGERVDLGGNVLLLPL